MDGTHAIGEDDMGFVDKATEKARELAELAKVKADEYEVREKAVEYGGKAAELAGRGVDTATTSLDRATGGRFHDQLAAVNTKVAETLERVAPDEPTDPTTKGPDGPAR